MFGRIQNIFLLFATISMSLMALWPVATIVLVSSNIEYSLFTYKLVSNSELIDYIYPALMLNLMVIILPFATIFLKVKSSKSIRPTLLLQLRFCIVSAVLEFGMLIMPILQVYLLSAKMDATWNLEYVYIFPVIAFILILLAVKGILKDISTINSYDRIR